MKKILIAIDNGPASEKVARSGFELAKQLGAEIALISVVDTEFLLTDGVISPGEMAEIIKKDDEAKQKMLVEKVFGAYAVSTFVEKGKPAEMILKVAGEWGADMVLLGTHGRTGISHLLLGSVAEKVLRHSSLPLVIIPTR